MYSTMFHIEYITLLHAKFACQTFLLNQTQKIFRNVLASHVDFGSQPSSNVFILLVWYMWNDVKISVNFYIRQILYCSLVH